MVSHSETDYGKGRQKQEGGKQDINRKAVIAVIALFVGSSILALAWVIVSVITAVPIYYDVLGGSTNNNINEAYLVLLVVPCGFWILGLTMCYVLAGAYLARYKGVIFAVVFVLLTYGVTWFACPWLWGASLGLPGELTVGVLLLVTFAVVSFGSVWLTRKIVGGNYQK